MKKAYVLYIIDSKPYGILPIQCSIAGIYTSRDLAIRAMECFNQRVEEELVKNGDEYEIRRSEYPSSGTIRTAFGCCEAVSGRKAVKYVYLDEMNIDVSPIEKGAECIIIFSEK